MSEEVVDLTQSFNEDHEMDDDLPDLPNDFSQYSTSTMTFDSQESLSSATSVTSASSATSVKEMKEDERKRKRAEKEIIQRRREEAKRLREEVKRQKEQEKAEKASARLATKVQRPGECMKYINVLLEQSIIHTNVGAKLLALLQDSEVNYQLEKFAIEKLICWQRQSLEGNDDEEAEVLIILDIHDFVAYVYASAKNTDDVDFSSYISQLRDNLPNKQLTIVVQGLEKYFRDVKTLAQRNYRENVLNEANKKSKKINVNYVITRLELEQVLVEIQLEMNINFKFLETDEEIAKLILMMTKAIAESPFKKGRNSEFSFLPDNKNCVKVSKDGRGLMKVWLNQFLQFNNLSPDVAKAIVAVYPSPMLLLRAYSSVSCKEAEQLLADIRVRRGAGVLETSRRIGKELSKRIYLYFTKNDPNFVLK